MAEGEEQLFLLYDYLLSIVVTFTLLPLGPCDNDYPSAYLSESA